MQSAIVMLSIMIIEKRTDATIDFTTMGKMMRSEFVVVLLTIAACTLSKVEASMISGGAEANVLGAVSGSR